MICAGHPAHEVAEWFYFYGQEPGDNIRLQPTTLALAALGGASLLRFRRKK